MALAVVTGVIASPAGTGNQTYSLSSPWPAGETPKAIIVWWTNQTAEGQVDDAQLAIGFGTYRGAAVQQVSIVDYSNDAQASMDGGGANFDSALLTLYVPGSDTLDAEVDLVSFDVDEFVLNWVDLPASVGTKVHYVALGGDDIEDASTGTFLLATAGGAAQEFTIAAGFGQPDLLLFANSPTFLNTLNIARQRIMLGVAKSDTERRAAVLAEDLDVTTSDSAFWNKSRAFLGLSINTPAADSEADLAPRANWPTDGFELDIPDLPAADTNVVYLALKGPFSTTIGSNSSLTSGSIQDNDAGFVPKLGLVFGGNVTAKGTVDNNHADGHSFGIGATDGTSEGWSGMSVEDAAADSDTYSYHSESKVLQMRTADDGSITGEADGSFSDNNFRLTWSDLDTVAREYNWLALGDALPVVPDVEAYISGVPELGRGIVGFTPGLRGPGTDRRAEWWFS